MNLLQKLRVAGHIVTDEEQRRPETSLLSAGREGKGQDGFGLARNPVERRRIIHPPARRPLGVGTVKLSAMKLSSIFLPSIRWMNWRSWICMKRQASVRHCSIHTTTLTTSDDLSSNRQSVIALKTLSESIILLVRWFGIKLLIAADSVFTKSVEKIVRIILIGQQ